MRRILLGLFVGLTLMGSPAMAVEEPKYTLVLQEGTFEVRDYPPSLVAEVTVNGDQGGSASRGFRLLAGYIFGGNQTRQSIPMTAPVAQRSTHETIPMTAPVTQSGSQGAWVVRFTMPSRYSFETLPQPTDPRVKLKAVTAARFAVVRFSGIANPKSFEAKAEEVLGFIKAHNFHAIGPATLAQYDPPWTLWFLRRNEVMIQIAP